MDEVVRCTLVARLFIIVAFVSVTLGGYHLAVAQSSPGGALKVENPQFPIVWLGNITCPTPNDCQADGMDTIFTTHDGGITWRHELVHGGGVIGQIACASIDTCIAPHGTAPGGVAATTLIQTRDGGKTWNDRLKLPNDLVDGASCPTSTICYVMGWQTPVQPTTPVSLWRSDDAGATWTRVHGQALYSVTSGSLACVGQNLCYVGGLRSVLVTRDGGRTWNRRALGSGVPPRGSVNQMSCVDPDHCYATFGNGPVVGTRNGWTTDRVLRPGHARTFHIACPTVSVCYVMTLSGTVLATTNSGATWKKLTVGSSNHLLSIACSSPATCTVVGANTTILTTHDAGATWHSGFPDTTNTLAGIACADASTCTAVGVAGTILSTSNGGQVWKTETSPVHDALDAVSCPTTTVCYAVGGSRAVFPSQGVGLQATTKIGPEIMRTSDGGITWSVLAHQPIGNRPLSLAGIACPTTDICFATSDSGSVLATTNGGQSWQWERTGVSFQLRGIACPTTAHCVAVGGLQADCVESCNSPEEGVVMVTDDGGSTWKRRFYRQVDLNQQPVIGAYLYSVSCPDATNCFAAGHKIVVKTVDGGQTWHQVTTPPLGMGGWPNAVLLACPSATMCWGSFGGPTLFTTQDGGRSWTAGPANPRPLAGPIFAVTCPGLDNCYAVGSTGLILRYSG